MTCTTRRPAAHHATVLTAFVLMLMWLVPTPAAASSVVADAEAGFLAAINAARAAEGLEALAVNDELAGIARTWAGAMDAADRMSHNLHYAAQYSGDWNRMGENVGYATWPGGSTEEVVARLHQAFMGSPGHRANIMGGYNQVGIGVVVGGDTTWVTVNFLDGPMAAAPLPVDVIEVPELPVVAPVRRHFSRR